MHKYWDIHLVYFHILFTLGLLYENILKIVFCLIQYFDLETGKNEIIFTSINKGNKHDSVIFDEDFKKLEELGQNQNNKIINVDKAYVNYKRRQDYWYNKLTLINFPKKKNISNDTHNYLYQQHIDNCLLEGENLNEIYKKRNLIEVKFINIFRHYHSYKTVLCKQLDYFQDQIQLRMLDFYD